MRILAKIGLCLAVASTSTATMADIIFNGTAIPSADITSIQIDPVTGDVLVTVANDWTVQQGGEPPPPPPPPPPVVEAPTPPAGATFWVGMNVSTNEIDQWEDVTFAWTSVGAVRCVTRLGNDEWLAQALDPANPTDIEITMTAAGVDQRFRIFCFDEAGAQVVTQQMITVIEAPEPPPPPPPPPTTETVSCDTSDVQFGDTLEWGEVFASNGFPEINQAGDDFFIGRNGYLAVRFETTDADVNGAIATVALSGGIRNVSISECPGNFVTDTDPACSDLQGIGDSLQYTTDLFDTTKCTIRKNKEYFINITYVDVTNRLPTQSSTCGVSSCLVRITKTTNVQ
jgi:hypothetical protein